MPPVIPEPGLLQEHVGAAGPSAWGVCAASSALTLHDSPCLLKKKNTPGPPRILKQNVQPHRPAPPQEGHLRSLGPFPFGRLCGFLETIQEGETGSGQGSREARVCYCTGSSLALRRVSGVAWGGREQVAARLLSGGV